MPLPRAFGAGRILGLSVAVAAAFGSAAFAASAQSQTGAATWSALTPIGSSLTLAAVSCPTLTFCAIANDNDINDDAGTMYTLSGTTLSKPTVISKYGGSPDSVSCPNSRFCIAIDDGGAVYRFNGTAWSKPRVIDSVPPDNQTAVSCASSTFCAAIDDGGDVELFNGTSWSESIEIDPAEGGYKAQNCTNNQEGTCSAPAAISCPSSNRCIAVDGTGSVFSFNGSSWSSATDVDGQTPITALSCAPASSFCVATDATGKAATFNGTSWSAPASVDASALDSVSCRSSSYCMAVDDSGDALTFNGAGWSAPAPVAKADLGSVSCASSSFCLALSQKSSLVSFGTEGAFPPSPIKLRASTAKIDASGTGSVPVSCPSGPRGCSESVSLVVFHYKHRAWSTSTLASSTVELSAGQDGTLKLKFSRVGLATLTQKPGHRLKVTVTADGDQLAPKLTLLFSRSS
jgi:hypothetical protein